MADDLVVDLHRRDLATLDAFRDAVVEPCGLPGWFGRNNLDAWWDTVEPESRGASPVIDAHDVLVVRAEATGLFAPGNSDSERLARLFAEANHARLEISQ